MDTEQLKRRIKEIIEPVINSLGNELEGIEFNRAGRKGILRVFIDKESGVTIDDCEHVSRAIEAVLDIEDPIPCSYVLEVSSPGLDRPLRGPRDFKRFAGRTARVITIEPVERQNFFVGEITEAGDEEMSLLMPKDKKVIIQYKNISKARLEVD